MQTPKDMIAAIEAFERGEEIEYRREGESVPWMLNNSPSWNFASYEFRPAPKLAECWVWVYDHGTVGLKTWLSKSDCENCDRQQGRSGPGRAVLMREVK